MDKTRQSLRKANRIIIISALILIMAIILLLNLLL